MPIWLIPWISRNRGAIELAGAVLMLAGFAWAWTHHAELMGAERCEHADTVKQVAELRGDLVESSRQADTIAEEARKNARDNLEPVRVPDVQLCHYSPAASTDRVPGTAAARSNSNGNVGRGASDSDGARQIADVKATYERLAKVGQRANAQLAELRAYVADVCRPAPAAVTR